jgi:hypothetical protein
VNVVASKVAIFVLPSEMVVASDASGTFNVPVGFGSVTVFAVPVPEIVPPMPEKLVVPVPDAVEVPPIVGASVTSVPPPPVNVKVDCDVVAVSLPVNTSATLESVAKETDPVTAARLKVAGCAGLKPLQVFPVSYAASKAALGSAIPPTETELVETATVGLETPVVALANVTTCPEQVAVNVIAADAGVDASIP